MAQNINLITFNTFGVPFHGGNVLKTLFKTKIRNRFNYIGSELNSSGADIVMLQEIYTIFHLNILKRKMSNFKYCYFKNSLTGPRGGVVTFSKTPMSEMDFIDFKSKGKWHNKSIVGKISNRGVLITRITNSPYYIINTHLTQNSANDWGEANTYKQIIKLQLDQITNIIKKFRNQKFIVAGDFNITKDTEIFKKYIHDTQLLDSAKNNSEPTVHEEYSFGKKYSECIDFILYSKNISIQNITQTRIFTTKIQLGTDKIYPSDHIGLHTKFNF